MDAPLRHQHVVLHYKTTDQLEIVQLSLILLIQFFVVQGITYDGRIHLNQVVSVDEIIVT